jgi:hypothetical protein
MQPLKIRIADSLSIISASPILLSRLAWGEGQGEGRKTVTVLVLYINNREKDRTPGADDTETVGRRQRV